MVSLTPVLPTPSSMTLTAVAFCSAGLMLSHRLQCGALCNAMPPNLSSPCPATLQVGILFSCHVHVFAAPSTSGVLIPLSLCTCGSSVDAFPRCPSSFPLKCSCLSSPSGHGDVPPYGMEACCPSALTQHLCCPMLGLVTPAWELLRRPLAHPSLF